MDFNKNGKVEESDAKLLVRAALDQVRFIESLHIGTPDHTIDKTCTFAIRTKLVLKDKSTVTGDNTQVFFEIASEKLIVQSQLKQTKFTKGKLIHLYEGRNGLWGGIVRLQYSKDGIFELESHDSYLEVQDLGISMIQVVKNKDGRNIVTPLFSSSREPSYWSAAVDVTLASGIRLQATNGHSPQLLFNVKPTASCIVAKYTKTINITFENEFATIATKQEEFKMVLRDDLIKRFPGVSITFVTVAPGSIRVGFQATAEGAILDAFIESLWQLLQSGYTLTFDDVTFVATKTLLVNGRQKLESSPVAAFPVAMVVSICVVMVVMFVLVGLVVHCRHRCYGYNRWIKTKNLTRIGSR